MLWKSQWIRKSSVGESLRCGSWFRSILQINLCLQLINLLNGNKVWLLILLHEQHVRKIFRIQNNVRNGQFGIGAGIEKSTYEIQQGATNETKQITQTVSLDIRQRWYYGSVGKGRTYYSVLRNMSYSYGGNGIGVPYLMVRTKINSEWIKHISGKAEL